MYVAASRVGHPGHIKFALERGTSGAFLTPNVVYRDALSSIHDVLAGYFDEQTGADWEDCELAGHARACRDNAEMAEAESA